MYLSIHHQKIPMKELELENNNFISSLITLVHYLQFLPPHSLIPSLLLHLFLCITLSTCVNFSHTCTHIVS